MDKKTELAIDLGQAIYNNTITALQAKIAKLEAHNETRNIKLLASVQQCAQLKAQLAELSLEQKMRKLAETRNSELISQLAERDAECRAFASNLRGKHAITGATYATIISDLEKTKQQLADAQKLLRLAKDALEKVVEKPKSHESARMAFQILTAINDSKAVEGLILCDAVTSAWARYPRYTGKAQKPEIVFEQPEGTDWESLHAPRRTEK